MYGMLPQFPPGVFTRFLCRSQKVCRVVGRNEWKQTEKTHYLLSHKSMQLMLVQTSFPC